MICWKIILNTWRKTMIKSAVTLLLTWVLATLFSSPDFYIHIIGFGYLLGIMFRDISAKGMRLHLLFLWNLSLKRWIRVVVKSELVLLRIHWQHKCWFGISFVTLVHVSHENWGQNIIAFHKTLLSSFWVTIVISICTWIWIWQQSKSSVWLTFWKGQKAFQTVSQKYHSVT